MKFRHHDFFEVVRILYRQTEVACRAESRGTARVLLCNQASDGLGQSRKLAGGKATVSYFME
jgi:hypothetical protein